MNACCNRPQKGAVCHALHDIRSLEPIGKGRNCFLKHCVFGSFMRFRFGFQIANHTLQSSTCSPEILVSSRALLVTRIKPLRAAIEAICKMSNPNIRVRKVDHHSISRRVGCGSVHRVHEVIDRKACSANQTSQGTFGNFLVIGNRQSGDMPLAHQDHVATTLTNLQPAE